MDTNIAIADRDCAESRRQRGLRRQIDVRITHSQAEGFVSSTLASLVRKRSEYQHSASSAEGLRRRILCAAAQHLTEPRCDRVTGWAAHRIEAGGLDARTKFSIFFRWGVYLFDLSRIDTMG